MSYISNENTSKIPALSLTQQGKKRISTPQKKTVLMALIILAFILSISTTVVVISNLEYYTGYSNGTHDGYRTGHTDGQTQGYRTGYSDGQTQGYQSGYSNGQIQGISTWVYQNCSSYPFLLLDPNKYMACLRLHQ